MLPKKINFVLAIFDFFGFYTKPPSCIYKIILLNIFHLVFFGCFAYCCILYLEFESIRRQLEKLNLTVQICGALCTYALILIASIFNRDPQREFWNIYNKIQRGFGDRKHFFWRSFVIKFIEHNIVTTSFIAFLLYKTYNFYRMTLLAAVEILVKISQFRMFHYIFYVDIIRMNLSIVQVEAIRASILIGTVKESTIAVREIYMMIFEMGNKLIEIFGFSHLATVLYCFYCPIVDLNWAFVHFRYLLLSSKIGKIISIWIGLIL